jgi:4-amino-4-deoxy-L-arabinose transferase-like glycosyltransferase
MGAFDLPRSSLSASVTDNPWRTVLALTLLITVARYVALAVSPLELYPDEAQYWLWSRQLDWGYYSKPPMIAWTIWATTAIGGNAEGWVRAASPLFHAGAGLAVFAIGRRLYDARTGLAAACLYILMPGVQLSSLVAATDAPLLFFLSVALLAYVALPATDGARRLAVAAGFGLALGLAFLSKYAALYALIGLALHLALSREGRRAWSPAATAAAVLAFAAALAPNLAWNAAHDFSTVQHTAANAHWDGRKLFDFAELGDFLASQFGVFGPIPFAVLIGGTVAALARRRLAGPDLLLACFALPPLLIVMAQAFISRANANWSGAAYVAGVVLAAAWLVRWKAVWWRRAALALQGLVAVVFLACVIDPTVAERIGLSNAFKRAKGWEQLTQAMIERTMAEGYRSVSAVAVDDRFLFNAAAYYGRDFFGRTGSPPLRMWVRTAHPQNQAEATAPLRPAEGRRVLAASLESGSRDEMARDFGQVSGGQIVSVRLDRKRKRQLEMFVGEYFQPRPRDSRTGLPPTP